jgi:hypothetical protein
LVSRPHLPEEGPIETDPAPAGSEAPEADENQDTDEAEGSLEESDSTTSPPPAISEDRDLEKKRKRIGDVASSSTSILKDASGSLLLPGILSQTCSSCWTHKFTSFCFPVFLFSTLLLLLDVE